MCVGAGEAMRGRGNSRQQPKPPTFPAAMNALLPSVNSNPTCVPSTPAAAAASPTGSKAKERSTILGFGRHHLFFVLHPQRPHTLGSPRQENK